VVKLLLSDPRVNPSAGNQAPIRIAIKHNKVRTVKVLLEDRRVAVRCGYASVSRSPKVVSLMLLRHEFRSQLKSESKDMIIFIKYNIQIDCRSVITDIEAIESKRQDLLGAHLVPDLSRLCLEYVPDLFCHEKQSEPKLWQNELEAIQQSGIPWPLCHTFRFTSLSTL
jgi:hypothetical protein